jgi:AraC-like DNA-binding protein
MRGTVGPGGRAVLKERDTGAMPAAERDPRELDGAWSRHQRHAFPEPAPDLAPFVERFWVVEWSYATPYRQKVVPYPNVHLTVQTGAAPEVSGVASRHVVKVLSGAGRVVGAQFRAGAFRPLLGGPVAALTDRTLPAADVPGLAEPWPVGPVDVPALERWLRNRLPAPDPAGQEAGAAVALVAADRTITRVDQLAAVTGIGVRRLQRLFAEHVGVGPKWVIRRYRLHEVTERMAAGAPIGWADLAGQLGYADQAHLVRDFVDLFGEPPTRYSRRYAAR